MIVGIVIGSIVFVLLIAFFVFLFWIYRKFFINPKEGRNDEYRLKKVGYEYDAAKLHALVDKIRQIPYEDLWIKSNDGLKLHAYFYENKNSNHYILMFNGYQGIPRRDYCAKAMDLMKQGYNVVLCDQRAHGYSDGNVISLGRKEKNDVLPWVKFAKEKWGNSAKITVAGISMGASTVLYAADQLPEDISVFADSAYATEKDLIWYLIKRRKLNPRIIWPMVYLSGLIFGHFRLKDDAAETVARAKCRILIIHGAEDTIVPIETNKKLFECNKEHVQVEIFESLNHALAFLKQTDKYRKILYEFLEK